MSNFSYVDHIGDGSTTAFTFSFVGQGKGYIRDSDVYAYVNGLESLFVLSGENQITFAAAPDAGSKIRIRRIMPKSEPFANFSRGNAFTQDLLNKSFLQTLYAYHEFLDGFLPEFPFKLKGTLDMSEGKIIGLKEAVVSSDPVLYSQLMKLYDDLAAYSSSDVLAAALAAKTSTVEVAGILAKDFRNFLIITPPAGDAGAYINSLIAEGIRYFYFAAGKWIFNTSVNVNNIPLSMLGAGKTITIFKRGPSLGTANIINGTGHDLTLHSIGFDLGKGTYTPTLANPQLENAINSVSPNKLKVNDCDFQNLVAIGVVVNGTALALARNIDISGNTARNGSRGLAHVVRYASVVNLDRNIMVDIIDSSLGGVAFEKPLVMAGTHHGSMSHNNVSSTNGEGGPLIVEYIDRESKDIQMLHNSYTGQIFESYYKVGASTDVWFIGNSGSGGAQVGAYFEGVENLWVLNNTLADTTENSLVLAQDAQTLRFCKKIKVKDNHFINANTGGNEVGIPYVSLGTPQSYHVWAQDGTEQIELEDNHYIKRGAAIAGGTLISSPSYTIKGEDFSKLDASAVAIHNGFAPIDAKYEIIDCIGCKTTDKGQAVVGIGNATVSIPHGIVRHFNPTTQLTLKSALSGTVAYIFADPDTVSNTVIACRDTSHAPASATSIIRVDWTMDCSKEAKGALGKTL